MENKYKDMNTPFLALSYNLNSIAVPKELIVDYDNGTMYIKATNGVDNIEIGRVSIPESIDNEIKKLIGNVDEDGNTMRKIRDIIRDLEDWKNRMSNPDTNNIVDTLVEILNKFKDMPESAPTIKQQLDSKVDVVQGKGLSTNDFTNELKNKLDRIEDGANYYIHPNTKQCDYVAPIRSINGKVGNVVITKSDIGLNNINPNANKYIHPKEKVCNVKVVSKVNNKTGTVSLTKSDFSLNNIMNYGIATEADINNKVSNKYMTPKMFYFMLNKYVEDNNLIDDDFSLWGAGVIGRYGYDEHTKLIRLNNDIEWKYVSYNHGLSKEGGLYSLRINNSGEPEHPDFYFIRVGNEIGFDEISGISSYILLKEDKSVWVYGSNKDGCLGVGHSNPINTPLKLNNNRYKKIHAGSLESFLMIDSNDFLWGMGYNDGGRLGLPSSQKIVTSLTKIGNDKWKDVLQDGNISYGIKIDGTLWKWGVGLSSPEKIGTSTDWNKFGGRVGTVFIIKNNGYLWGFGDNIEGELGLGTTTYVHNPTLISNYSYKHVFHEGWSSTFAIRDDGTLWATGANDYGQLGLGHKNKVNKFTKVDNGKWISAVSYGGVSFAIKGRQ